MDRIYVMELVQSFQTGVLSRREFVNKAVVALGSLAAANMLLTACAEGGASPTVVEGEQTVEPEVETDDGLVAGSTEYRDVDGGTLTGYWARPADAESDPRPGIVVIQEWWGLNEHIKDVTRRFAREGFVALAPDLYHGKVVSEPDEARKLVMELDTENAVREIQQAMAHLIDQPFVAGSEVGIVGFCMGGGLVLQTARVTENLGAGVAFYGSPLSPDQAEGVQAPILGLYGADDQGIPVDRVRAMEQGFNDAGVENDIHVYDGAGHAFFNDTRESYHSEAAQDAWQKTLAWFREHVEA